ncbi:MAG TPA: hypothetical protein DCK87_07630 [Desulfotomaculum sp.]|nr:hypothetical protein [Desulfotomaculum sp.]
MGLFYIVTCLEVSSQDTRLKKTGEIKDKKNLDKKINGYKIKNINIFKYLNILIYKFVELICKRRSLYGKNCRAIKSNC